MKPFAAIVFGICFLSTSAAVAQVPDLILLNGKIITVDDQFSIVQAVAVKGERFMAVGGDAEIAALAKSGTRRIDLHGRTVIPGLIDNHNHIIRATEYWPNEVRLDGITSRTEAISALKAKDASLPEGAWLFSLGGWGEEQFRGGVEGDGFSLDELDAIASHRPLFLQIRYDYAYANSAWFVAMGIPITGERVSEGLGHFVERDETGRVTGRLEGGFPMIGAATAAFPPVTEAQQLVGIKALVSTLNGMGLTTVFDPGGLGIREQSYARIRKLAGNGELTLRIYHSLWDGTVPNAEAADHLIHRLEMERPFEGNPSFDRIAAGELLHAPFHFDNPVTPSAPSPEARAVIFDVLAAAAKNGWPIEIHAIQHETIAAFLDIAEEVGRTIPIRPLRWSITHADNIGLAEVLRARNMGMTLKLRSVATIGGTAGVFAKFGDTALHMPPFHIVRDSGIPFGLGTDGTKGGVVNPFITLWWAVTGKALDGKTVLNETLTREEALIAHTRANAYILFREADIGAIKPGLFADMLVLDRDFLTVPADEIKDIRPVTTLLGGKVVHGKLPGLGTAGSDIPQ